MICCEALLPTEQALVRKLETGLSLVKLGPLRWILSTMVISLVTLMPGLLAILLITLELFGWVMIKTSTGSIIYEMSMVEAFPLKSGRKSRRPLLRISLYNQNLQSSRELLAAPLIRNQVCSPAV